MSEAIPAAFSMVGGLAVLVAGGEIMVRGASGVAAALRISPLVIGLTVVAFGTSAPELAISVQAAFAGSADVAVGNVVGSNIFNVLVVIGLSALIVPLLVDSPLIRRDVPLMILASFVLYACGWDGNLGRIDGGLFFGSLLIYIVWIVRQSRRESQEVVQEYADEFGPEDRIARRAVFCGGLALLSLVPLALGSQWLVAGSVAFAKLLNVSELVIGLTVVAVGTSSPEVVTSVVAAIRGKRDIAVGNAVGSSLFNILCVLGVSSLVAPRGIDVSATALHFDIPVLIAVAVACLPIFLTGHVIARWEGALFLFYYLAYIAYLVLEAAGSAHQRTLTGVMTLFVIPLTVVTMAVGVFRHLRERRQALDRRGDP